MGEKNKHTIIYLLGILEGEEREKRIESLLEGIMVENFLNLREGNKYPDTGIPEPSKQDKLKHSHQDLS